MFEIETQGILRRASLTALTVLAATLSTARPCIAQQSQDFLRITSPLSGTSVNPGQAISVAVSSPAGMSFTQVFVVGEDPLGVSNVAGSLPSQFTLSIPVNLTPRKYLLTAWGVSSAAQVVQSSPIMIDVERPDAPTQVSAEPRAIKFESQGEQLPIRIWGTFTDGSYVDLTESSNVSYMSSNPLVATVGARGFDRRPLSKCFDVSLSRRHRLGDRHRARQ
jgi:hypothetical protein